MRRYNVPRLFREIERDLLRFSKWCGKMGDAMKFIGPILAGLAVAFGGYLTWHLRVSVNVPLLIIVLFLIPYIILKAARCRRPELEVGELIPDDSPGSHSFHVKVKNHGPGMVIPTVTVTYLRDENGKHLPDVPESYQPRESHWRGATTAYFNPQLGEGQQAYAGVLDVKGLGYTCPYLCTYPNDLCAEQQLWFSDIPLEKQRPILLSFIVSHKGSREYIERSYRVIPDESQPLRYRLERMAKPF